MLKLACNISGKERTSVERDLLTHKAVCISRDLNWWFFSLLPIFCLGVTIHSFLWTLFSHFLSVFLYVCQRECVCVCRGVAWDLLHFFKWNSISFLTAADPRFYCYHSKAFRFVLTPLCSMFGKDLPDVLNIVKLYWWCWSCIFGEGFHASTQQGWAWPMLEASFVPSIAT